MADFPVSSLSPLTIATPTQHALAVLGTCASSSSNAGNVSPTKERAVYIPFVVPNRYPVARVFWVNGATVTSSENDLGIYTLDGKRLYRTGKTVLSGATQTQFVTPSTPFLLSPGTYYFALLFVSGTVTSRWYGFGGTVTAEVMRAAGIREQGGITELPETATFASATALTIPHIGVTRTASGF